MDNIAGLSIVRRLISASRTGHLDRFLTSWRAQPRPRLGRSVLNGYLPCAGGRVFSFNSNDFGVVGKIVRPVVMPIVVQ